jgi:hypothetical protein
MTPENVMAGAAAMVRLSAGVVAVSGVGVPESVTRKVRSLYVPAQAAVGVPVIDVPDAEVTIFRHDGNVPLARVHVYGEMPPVTVRVAE